MSKGISETAFASQIFDLLTLYQWRWCHIRPAYSERGWRTPIQGHDPDGFKGKGLPDIIAVRPPRLLFAEIKNEYGKPMPEQEAWLNDLRECVKIITTAPIVKGKPLSYYNAKKAGTWILPEIYLWRPSDIEAIVEILR